MKVKIAKTFKKDLELTEACNKGDSIAQTQLYNLYSKPMFGLCLRMMGNKSDAEDVFQNAFIAVFTKLKTYKAKAPLQFWIKRIFINYCIDELKSRKVIESFEESYLEVIDTENIVVDYNVQAIKSAISKLAAGFRTVLNMYLFEGYNHKEIAEFLGISESTSKSQYSRAKLKLKQLLIKEGRYEKA